MEPGGAASSGSPSPESLPDFVGQHSSGGWRMGTLYEFPMTAWPTGQISHENVQQGVPLVDPERVSAYI